MNLFDAVMKLAWRIGRRLNTWLFDWSYSWYVGDRLREAQDWCEGFLTSFQSFVCGGFATGSTFGALLTGLNKLIHLLLR